MLSVQLVKELGELRERLVDTDYFGALKLGEIINLISPSVVKVEQPKLPLTPDEVEVVRRQSNYFGPLFGWAHYIRPDAVLARARGAEFCWESQWSQGQRMMVRLALAKDMPIILKAQRDLARGFGEATFDQLLKKWNTECVNNAQLKKPSWFNTEV